MKIFRGTLLLSFLLLGHPLPSQIYTGKACKPDSNPQLSGMLHRGVVDSLAVGGSPDWRYRVHYTSSWSSSILKPDGTPPKAPEKYDLETEILVVNRDVFTCQYSAYFAQDANPKTGWAEGVPGDGVGEALVLPVDTQRPIRIWAGLGTSDDLFRANNRPRLVMVYVLQPEQLSPMQGAMGYADIKVIARSIVELKDVNGFQPLAVPHHTLRPNNWTKTKVSFIGLEILSVYPGQRYQDTVISEVQNQ